MTHDSKTRPAFQREFLMFVIYDQPHDAPDGYLVRAWSVANGMVIPGKVIAHNVDTLEQARARIPGGRHNIGRSDGDDAKIVEVWV